MLVFETFLEYILCVKLRILSLINCARIIFDCPILINQLRALSPTGGTVCRPHTRGVSRDVHLTGASPAARVEPGQDVPRSTPSEPNRNPAGFNRLGCKGGGHRGEEAALWQLLDFQRLWLTRGCPPNRDGRSHKLQRAGVCRLR